jgi:hypothetical protein
MDHELHYESTCRGLHGSHPADWIPGAFDSSFMVTGRLIGGHLAFWLLLSFAREALVHL